MTLLMPARRRVNLGGRPPLFREAALLTVKLEARDLDALRRLAEERGTKPSTLAREWIVARLRRGTPRGGTK
jgi:hypothetical protein